MKQFYVYFMASKKHGVLYLGVTSDLVKRTYVHRNSLVDGFSKRYSVKRLVWFESHESAESAISCEKQIKKWQRDWKIQLIEEINPNWEDLYESILQ